MSTLATDALNLTGSFGAECFRATCHAIGADWLHHKANRYYCAACAAEINLDCKLKGELPVCSKQG